MRSWECDVCGHIHEGEAAPEKCPVCDAPSENFVEVTKKASETIKGNSAEDGVERKWRCTLCGYVHTGTAPPETCPVCNAGPEMFEEVLEEETEEEQVVLVEKRWKCTVCGYIHTGPFSLMPPPLASDSHPMVGRETLEEWQASQKVW